MLERVPEPELMDSPEQTLAYSAADFSEPNGLFCEHVRVTLPSTEGRLIDLGCGSGGLLFQLAHTLPGWSMVGLDAGPNMLKIARETLADQPLSDRVSLQQAHLPTDLDTLALTDGFDAVVSNSLLHHLKDPMTLWESARQLGASGAHVVVMDLSRPQSISEAQSLVERHTAGASPILKQDFYNSLLAAWQPHEVQVQLERMGYTDWTLIQPSNRHWMVIGQLP